MKKRKKKRNKYSAYCLSLLMLSGGTADIQQMVNHVNSWFKSTNGQSEQMA